MTWGTLFVAMAGPVVTRAAIALGFTAVTFTGISAGVDALVTYAQSSWAAIPLSLLQLATLSGIPEMLGMMFGAVLARVAMYAAVGASRYVLKT